MHSPRPLPFPHPLPLPLPRPIQWYAVVRAWLLTPLLRFPALLRLQVRMAILQNAAFVGALLW